MRSHAVSTLIGFLFFYCSACSFTDTKEEKLLKDIYGTWEWIWSSGGFTGDTIYPSSETGRVLVVFAEGHVYTRIGNKKIREQGVFSLGYDEARNLALITYKNGGHVYRQWYYLAAPRTLTLLDQGADGFVSGYVKIAD
ncbi:MAG: hypothetical protein AAF564_24005 [Bacteroidota bacterium]